MQLSYPYPTLDQDGYELDVIEQDGVADYGFDLPEFPEDAARFSVTPGMLVKLVFRYRDWVEENGHTITCERMWVKVTGDTGVCLSGELDSGPRYTKLLKEGDLVHFHPKHIIQIWK